MGHGVAGHERPAARLDAQSAVHVANTLQALATPSRLLILTELRQGPRPVTELANAVGMEQSAVSHQLRLLRNLGLVTGLRAGRSIIYRLFDNHVAQLLDEAIYHSEHLRLGLTDTDTPASRRSQHTEAPASRRSRHTESTFSAHRDAAASGSQEGLTLRG